MDAADHSGESHQLQSLFPISRYIYFGGFRFYYGYGNTPPDDYLEHASRLLTKPRVLILGCGDLRSCLYTLWKSFDSHTTNTPFDGVHFVLNDNSAAVLARDILILYLCLKMPELKEAVKEWLCAVWAIWFCHELMPKHESILNDALSSLIKFSLSTKAWISKDNPLHTLVKFTSPQVLSEISQVWKMWHEKDVQGVKSVAAMNSARLKEQSGRLIMDTKTAASKFVAAAVGSRYPEEVQSHMLKEVSDYFEKGSVFAEEVIYRSERFVSNTVVNFTLYERRDGRYTLHYSSVPFKCFYQSFQYSEKELLKIKLPQHYHDCLLIHDTFFEIHPLLANSVQQLGLWIQACAGVLKKEDTKFTFTIHHSDAIEFCQELQSPLHYNCLEVVTTFDVIYASNLIDHLSPPNLILSALPLLNPSGHLFTLTLNYKTIGSTTEEYIQGCFGFDSKLLPIVFGIRCFNHEGSNYSSNVSVQPLSVELGNPKLINQWPKLLVWGNVCMQPQKLSSLNNPTIVTALCHSIILCATSLMFGDKGDTTLNTLCLETAIKMLQYFSLTVDSDTSTFQFWLPLCEQLLKEDGFKKFFLHSFQTQCLLHYLHLHLAVSPKTCPICKAIPVDTYVQCCFIKVKLPLSHTGITPMFMIFLHPNLQFNNIAELYLQAASGADVNAFDCFTGNTDGHNLVLKFYCPQTFKGNGYTATLVSFTPTGGIFGLTNLPSIVKHVKLDECYTPGIAHFFQRASVTRHLETSYLGSIAYHSGSGDNFETIFNLSDEALLKLEAGAKINVNKQSSSEITILCGNLQHGINYPYPIAYNALNLKISRKKKNITIKAPRASQNFEEEISLFLVNPKHKLSLLPITISPQEYETASVLQFTKQEEATIIACQTCGNQGSLPPMIGLKQTISNLLQFQDRLFIYITVCDRIRVFIVIQSGLFDIQHQTPAIDLAFCILEESIAENSKLITTWASLSPSSSGIEMSEDEYDLLKKVLIYFSKRTISNVSDSKDEKQFKILYEYDIGQCFTRAVVYPLYSDPDTFAVSRNFPWFHPVPVTEVSNMTFTQKHPTNLDAFKPDTLNSTSSASNDSKQTALNKCCQCGNQSPDLKKCSNCGEVQYCGRECQKKHWKVHKAWCRMKHKKSNVPSKQINDEQDEALNNKCLLSPFPNSRCIYNGDRLYYYGYGNTPPEDYLECVCDVTEPTILLLGCGDMRSCFYTLWKNFDQTTTCRFSGVHFVLNDRSAAVLARNILFLYLCLKMPKEKEDIKEWLCAVWAIWFCHELMPKHEAVLNDALSSLIKFSSSAKCWTTKDNPLHSLIKFTSPQVLSEINQVWKMWYTKDISGVKSVEEMNLARKSEQVRTKIKTAIDNGTIASSLVSTAVGAVKLLDLSEELRTQMESEVNSYCNTGSVFIETTICDSIEGTTNTVVNYTLYEREDGLYTLHYGSVPFQCFHHSFQFSPKQLKNVGEGTNLVPDNLLIDNSSFEITPLLANSMQQLALWFQSCAKVLCQENVPNISFTVHCSDALEFCQILRCSSHAHGMTVVNLFDLIYTSNLIDYVSPPNLVLSAIPLLKQTGYLFTSTLLYKGIGSTAEEYISACFGFESKLLPVIFGIRCINHEGSRYSSVIPTQSIPWEMSNAHSCKHCLKLLIWEKVQMHPLKIFGLASASSIITAFCHAAYLCTTILLIPPQRYKNIEALNSLCVETVVNILLSFAAVVDAEVANYQLWSPLCQELLQVKPLKPFLHALQTQFFLHNLHIHLTATEGVCPICKGLPLNEHVNQVSFKVSLDSLRSQLSPLFMVFFHKTDFNDAKDLHSQALSRTDVHVFDSFIASKEEDNLVLNFYCPSFLVSKDAEEYFVTLVSYTIKINRSTEEEFSAPIVTYCKKLNDCIVSNLVTHSFQKAGVAQPLTASNLGSVMTHFGDGDKFETVLMLSNTAFSKLTTGTKISTDQISPSKVNILCGKLKHDICYPYPIDYNSLKLKISRKQKSVTISAPRAAHNFEDENAFSKLIRIII